MFGLRLDDLLSDFSVGVGFGEDSVIGCVEFFSDEIGGCCSGEVWEFAVAEPVRG